jgi:hypothetical protein
MTSGSAVTIDGGCGRDQRLARGARVHICRVEVTMPLGTKSRGTRGLDVVSVAHVDVSGEEPAGGEDLRPELSAESMSHVWPAPCDPHHEGGRTVARGAR